MITEIDLRNSEDEIPNLIKGKKQIKFNLESAGELVRARIRASIRYILKGSSREGFVDEAADSVFELIFNAFKGNYCYAIALDYMDKYIPEDKKDKARKVIFEDSMMMRLYLGLINTDQVNNTMKKALREERDAITQREIALSENRELRAEEQRLIDEKLEILHKTINHNLGVTLMIFNGDDRITFEILNDAPISDTGLNRIKSKRANFRQYFDDNRVADFYMENLDETESAGFGCAMIDLRLLELGIEPADNFTVDKVNQKTVATLTIPY